MCTYRTLEIQSAKSCDVEYKVRHKHDCSKMKCKKCNQYYTTQPHYCFIQPKNIQNLQTEDIINKIIVAYDIESTQQYGEPSAKPIVSKDNLR